jgi:allantoin racemase
MKTRIWYQSMTPLGRLPNYKDCLQRHAERVCQDGVEISVNGASEKWFAAHMPGQIFRYAYAKHVIQGEIIGICRGAEAQGYDAVILGSFSEPYLVEIRSVLSIPVISMAESSMLLACSMAEQFSLVALSPSQVGRLRHVVERHGLGERMREIVTLAHPVHEKELDDAFAKPKAIIDDFSAAAKRAVDAGADVVIPAEGVLNEVIFWNEVKSIDSATVLDSVGASLLFAELMVNMKRKLGLGVGRRWAYAMPPADVMKALDANS